MYRSAQAEAALERERLEFLDECFRLKALLAKIKAELDVKAPHPSGYNPDQPRVPAGNPDGGQWTRDGGSTQLAANEKPPRPSAGGFGLVFGEVAKRLIEAYRSQSGQGDLFGRLEGTVAVTTMDGKDIFGSNSASLTYRAVDREAALRLRDALIEKYPDLMDTQNVGRRPNDAVFHAEATVLLRAARENGGTLAGKELEVYADRNMCPSCVEVMPYVGVELGNPTVTFVGPKGSVRTMRNGAWVK